MKFHVQLPDDGMSEGFGRLECLIMDRDLLSANDLIARYTTDLNQFLHKAFERKSGMQY